MTVNRRASREAKPKPKKKENLFVCAIAIFGIIAALYYLKTRTAPPDRYETVIEQPSQRLDAPDSRPNDPISVSDKPPPGKK